MSRGEQIRREGTVRQRQAYRMSGIVFSLVLVLVACTATQPGDDATPGQDDESSAQQDVQLVDWGFSGDIQEMFREHLAEPFEEDNPGVTVELLGGITEDALAQIRAAQGASPYDTMLLGEPRFLAAQREGWLMTLSDEDIPNKAETYENIQEACAPEAVAWTVETIGVVYNPDLVPRPESWTDLWNPEYEGMIGMASPSSNAGFLFMVGISKLFGEGDADWDVVFEKLEELQPFSVAANPEALGQLLQREEIGIAINWATEAAVVIESGFEVEFAFPAPGPIAQIGCYAVLGETAHPELAKAYVNEALGVDFQTAMSQAPYFFAPVNRNVTLTPEAEALIPAPEDYPNLITVDDWDSVLADRQEVTDRFTRTFGQ